MKKYTFLLLMICSLFLFVGCDKDKLNEKETSSSLVNETENSIQNKKEYEYAAYLGKDYLWNNDDPFEMEIVKNGNIEYESIFYDELNKAEHSKKYAVRFDFPYVSDSDEIKDICMYLANDLCFENNFSNRLEADIDAEINSYGALNLLFFVTKEQLYSIKWPQDLQILVFWENKELQLEVTEEGIDYYINEYGNRKFPVRFSKKYSQDSGKIGLTREEVIEKMNDGYKIYWDWEMMHIYFETFK